MKTNEKNAKGVRGFLLYSPVKQRYFFRVYRDNTFIDYAINAEEIEVEIVDDWISLYDDPNRLDFSSKALGK